MNITSLGVLLCIGYESGEIYIYNVSVGEAVMSIHTRLSSVSALLLLCSDSSATSDVVGDGVLFVGYEDGFIEGFNCKSGQLMISKQCHYGSVQQILTFSQDYYVFSIGSDDGMCSFLVYSQLVTMKSVQNSLWMQGDNIRVNWYRGHTAELVAVYRNEWCLISDLVCCELANGEIYVWCVSTAQLERRLLVEEALMLNMDRSFYLSSKRQDLPHLTKHEREVYQGGHPRSKYGDTLILDIRVLGDVSLHQEVEPVDVVGVDQEDHSNNNLAHWTKQRQIKQSQQHSEFDVLDSPETTKLSNLLSLLLDWGIGAEYERLYLQEFQCLISDIAPCYGYCGDFESQTLLFPLSSGFGGRWRIQPKVTAVYMLAINTICTWLLQCAPNHKLPACSQLVTYYHVQLPLSFRGFVEPSRNSMARYCLNSVSEIRQSSRMLLHGIVQRMTDPMRLSLIKKWKKRFCVGSQSVSAEEPKQPPQATEGDDEQQQQQQQQTMSMSSQQSSMKGRNGRIPLSVLLGGIVICIIHSLLKNVVDDVVAESVINTLIAVLMERVNNNSDMIKISLSCDYLGKVIISWFRFVDDVEYLLKTLLDLRTCDHLILKKSASTALLQCGIAVPQSFIKTMGNEALIISTANHTATSSEFDAEINGNHHRSSRNSKQIELKKEQKKHPKHQKKEAKARRHEQALMCIINLVQKYPQVLLKHIPLLVSTIIRCLDPSAPRRRKALLSATTASLHVLVTKYPNMAFHQETQHFAIGTGPARDNCILIYDLRTTTRWKQLKGHQAAITAIQFNHDGSYLISYSAYERPPTVRCWDIGSGGFFNALLSGFNSNHSAHSNAYSSSKCVKTCPMPPLNRLYPPIDHLQYTKLTWNPKVKGAVKLQRENNSVLFFTVLPK